MLKFWVGHEDHEGPQRARSLCALLTRKFKVIAKHWSAACCFFFVHVVVLRGSASGGPCDQDLICSQSRVSVTIDLRLPA